MRTQKISFPNQQTPCVFADDPASLAQAITSLGLDGGYPVIMLIGGEIEEEHTAVTRDALKTLARIAEDTSALVISGGTDMGVMAEIGQIRTLNDHDFPLVGIAPEALVTWPAGPDGANFLWWGKKRSMLAPNYSHFILVPGSEFEDAMPWMIAAAAQFSKGHPSVTILVNGGNVFRKNVELNIENGHPVIALGGTGHLANDLAGDPNRSSLISIIPANAESRITEAVHAAISARDKGAQMAQYAAAQPDPFMEAGEPTPSEQTPVFISKRDEFSPINSDKSTRRIPESFIK